MRFATLLLPWALAAAPAAELYPRLDAPAANLIQNPSFDQGVDGELADWRPYQGGGRLAPDEGRDGGDALVCERTVAAAPGAGMVQTVVLNQTAPQPVLVSGWSRAEGVDGSVDVDYSLYCDLEYLDGTPWWGQIASFTTGTHDWQRAEVVIAPLKPIRSVAVYALFRNHLGKVWFDDFALAEMGGESGLLDGVPIATGAAPPPAGGEAHTAGGLELRLSDGRAGELTLGGRRLDGPFPGGFLARDAAADSGYHGFAGGQSAELGLALRYEVSRRDDALLIDGSVRDLRGTDRAVTLLFALPVASEGRRWWQDPNESQAVEPAGSYATQAQIEAGRGTISLYPFATMTGPEGGLNLGIDLLEPRLYRLGYSGTARLLYCAFDFGLSPATAAPGTATFRLVIFDSDPADGFRAGLDRYYRLFPEAFRVRTPEMGIWQAFAKISEVEGWEDFGFRFKEGDNETAWDDAHDILTFRYSEMGTFWMPMPPGVPREYDEAIRILNEHAADANSPYHARATATINSAMLDREGRYQLLFRDTPWCDGCVFSLNPSPALPPPSDAAIHWSEQQQEAYRPGASPELDGEYLDSLEGYVTAPLNFRQDHLARALLPPVFDPIEKRPVLYKIFSIAEFVRQIADDVHARGKLTMANGAPHRFGFLCAWFDLLGTETNWLHEGYTPPGDTTMIYWRAMAAKRPYLLLQNTDFAAFGPYVERYFARALAYGMLPSMFSHNAAEDHYFTKPEWYNRDRELFQRYLPQIRELAEEGWSPLQGARSDNPALTLERFGPGRTQRVFLTIHNPTDAPQTGTLTFDPAIFPNVAPQAISLEPYATEVLRPR